MWWGRFVESAMTKACQMDPKYSGPRFEYVLPALRHEADSVFKRATALIAIKYPYTGIHSKYINIDIACIHDGK